MNNWFPAHDKDLCYGCAACSDVCRKNAITMQADERGFLTPVINVAKCVQCGQCERTCPANTPYINQHQPLEVYAAKHKNESVLKASTSGGAFTALSDFVLNHGGIVYGAAHINHVETVHTRAQSYQERDKQRGAKYVQSDTRQANLQALDDLRNGNLVLFSGTPCEVDGFHRLVPKSLDNDNLLLVDVICNGVPSPMMFKAFIEYAEHKKGKKIKDHFHRSKEKGWGTHWERMIFQDGTSDSDSYISQGWKNIFQSGLIYRESCHKCPYASTGRVSDITIADFWGYENASLQIKPDGGLSMLIVNTERGKKALQAIEKEIDLERTSLQKAKAGQPRLNKPFPRPEKKEIFWESIHQKGAQYIIHKHCDRNLILDTKRKIRKLIK